MKSTNQIKKPCVDFKLKILYLILVKAILTSSIKKLFAILKQSS